MSLRYFLHYYGEYNYKNLFCRYLCRYLSMENTISNILQKFDLGVGKNGTSRNSLNFYFFIFPMLG